MEAKLNKNNFSQICEIQAKFNKYQICESCGRLHGYDYLARQFPNNKYLRCFWCSNVLKPENFYNLHPYRCAKKPDLYDIHFCRCISNEMSKEIEHFNRNLFIKYNIPLS